MLQYASDMLGKLNTEYYLAGGDGLCIMPPSQRGRSLAECIAGLSRTTRFNVDAQTQLSLVLAGDGPVIDDIGRLAVAFLQMVLSETENTLGRDDLYKRILLRRVPLQQMQMHAQRFGLELEMERRCIVLSVPGDADALDEIVAQVFDSDDADAVLLMSSGLLCVVLSKCADYSSEALRSLSEAMIDSARENGIEGVKVGVGEPRSTLAQLGESYDEALSSLSIGERFKLNTDVYIYKALIVERLLVEMPEDACRECYELVFNRRNSRLLNDEMLRTIKIFMDCNLNLSEAARYIYIHRNTLVYRLDKLQAATGLDLRKFDDAATIKFLMQLGNRLGDNT